MKKVFIIIVFVSGCFVAGAQNNMTLKEAIETGISNNFTVNQASLQADADHLNLQQSRLNRLPDLNASANHGINLGRSIDPITNSFINQKFNYASYGASTSVLLFNGLTLQNKIKQNSLVYDASKMELQQAKDNLTINIILAYLQVLKNSDVLVQSRQQAEVTTQQVNRLGILNDAGAISPSLYYDLKGQLANEQIAIADNIAALESAKVDLAQLLNMPYDKSIQLERLPEDLFNINYADKPDAIYQVALVKFAQVQSAHLRTESAGKNIQSIKGQYYPSLFFGVNANTNYSSAATQQFFVSSTDVPTSDYVLVNGNQQPVFTKQNSYSYKNVRYSNQLNNNLFNSVNLSLNIPIFNAFQVRNKVRLAKIDLKNYQLTEQNTKTVLQQAIEKAYVNLTNTSDKYRLLTGQVSDFTESFRGAEIKFNSGAITSVDYLVAKNNLDRTKNNLIMAKYDFILRTKILDYYQGKPLW
jgi:outer membrane protein